MKKTYTLMLGVTVMGSAIFMNRYPEIACTESSHPDCDDGNPWNGYWWLGEAWVPGYPSLDSWFTPAPVWSYGNAVFYGPGVMEATARYRGLDLDRYAGGVALMSPSDIGLPVWIRRPGHPWEGPFLVVDAAMRGDMYPVIAFRNEIVEVDYDTAVRWKMVEGSTVKHWRLENVQVSKIDPALLYVCRLKLVDYPEWWLDRYEHTAVYDSGTPLYRAPSTWRLHGQWVTFDSPTPGCESLRKIN
jgi:hypothetical protein